MAEPQYQERFRVALRRLTREIDNLRTEQAALAAYREGHPSNRFLTFAFVALLGDRLLRLIRIFEHNKNAASFWYLHRRAPQRMKNLDIARLKNLSEKLKMVRDLTFVHLDKKGIFNAVTIWQEAGITDDEIIYVVESVRRTLYDLWVEEFGEAPIPITDNEDPRSYKPTFEGLTRLMREAIAELSAANPSKERG